MAKKKQAEPVAEYGVLQCGGGPHSPFNYTVYRRHGSFAAGRYDKTITEVKELAIGANVKEYNEQKEHMKSCLAVFDKKQIREFEMPEYMKPAKYQCGQKVYAARGEVASIYAYKGVIRAIVWDDILKTWVYSITFKGYKQHSFQEGHGPLMDIVVEILEPDVYSLDKKDEARAVVAQAVDQCNKWWRKFNAKLKKLKEGDLKPGQIVE